MRMAVIHQCPSSFADDPAGMFDGVHYARNLLDSGRRLDTTAESHPRCVWIMYGAVHLQIASCVQTPI